MAEEEYPESAMIPSYRRLNVKKTVLALTLLGIAAGAAQAADSQILNSLLACNASYFKAIAKDKNIPETLKIRSGDMAFLKVEKQPLDIVMFPKPFKDSGLTVTGYVFNDEIIRYPGVPDMHTHFWGLIVKEDWKKAIDAFKVDWEAVDTRHMSAHANRMVRSNNEPVWKPYKRPDNYEYPEMDMTERAFHIQPYNGQTMIFCAMQTAGAPEAAIIQEVRPDLLQGENKVPIREEEIQKDQPKADAKKLPEGHPEIPAGAKLPEGHPAVPAGAKLPEGHPDISGAKK